MNPSELPKGVCVVLYRDGLFGVSQRIGKDGKAHMWQFPGGHVEPGETPLQAAVRELQEETGLVVDGGRLVFLAEVGPLRGYKGEDYMGSRYALMLGPEEHLQCKEPTKSTPWQWVTPEHLQTLDMLQQQAEFAIVFHRRVG